jgi:biopolymer transport protein ExbD
MLMVPPQAELPTEEEAEPLRLRRRLSDDDIDMDITPMIDMTFLLLIFFLVSSTPDQQTAIDLPEAHHGVTVSQLESVTFTLAEGGISVAPAFAADGRIPGTELPDELDARRDRVRELVEKGFRDDKSNVLIKGDKNVAHRDVAQLVKAASQVPGVKIHLAVMETD